MGEIKGKKEKILLWAYLWPLLVLQESVRLLTPMRL